MFVSYKEGTNNILTFICSGYPKTTSSVLKKEGDHSPVFSFLDGTQYAKSRYAVRKNPVISYANSKFYFKKVQVSARNTKHEV